MHALIVFIIALFAAGPGDAPADGPFGVRTEDDIVLEDATRPSSLRVRVYAPVVDDSEREISFPLVVFSHGMGGSRRAFERECAYWASHGYVVALPEHLDAGVRRDPARRREAFGGLNQRERWERRVLDQKLVIDRVAVWAREVEGLGVERVDLTRAASAGHSFGAHTSALMGGVTVDTGHGPAASFRDERVCCVVPISNQGPGAMGLTETSWSAMDLPALFVTGTEDSVGAGMTPEDRVRAFELATPGDKHLLVIDGAAHGSFQQRRRGAPGSGNTPEKDRAIAHHTRRVVLVFLDAHLKGCEEAGAFLASAGEKSWENEGGEEPSETPERVGASTGVFSSR